MAVTVEDVRGEMVEGGGQLDDAKIQRKIDSWTELVVMAVGSEYADHPTVDEIVLLHVIPDAVDALVGVSGRSHPLDVTAMRERADAMLKMFDRVTTGADEAGDIGGGGGAAGGGGSPGLPVDETLYTTLDGGPLWPYEAPAILPRAVEGDPYA